MNTTITTQQDQDAYRSGRQAREGGQGKDSCSFGAAEIRLRNWWLAGWNDKDLEID